MVILEMILNLFSIYLLKRHLNMKNKMVKLKTTVHLVSLPLNTSTRSSVYLDGVVRGKGSVSKSDQRSYVQLIVDIRVVNRSFELS